MPSSYQLAAAALTCLLPLLAFAFFTSYGLGKPGAPALAVLLAFSAFALWGVRFMADRTPSASRPLGTLLSVQLESGGLFSPPVSVLETSTGFYAVRGTVSAARGAAVAEERGPLGTTHVCIARTCYAAAGDG